jgi:hypothetical protein
MNSEKFEMTFGLQVLKGMYKTPYGKSKRELEHLSSLVGDSTPIFGNSSSLNYYFVNIYIGNPPQKQAVIIDTGSHLTSVPCMPHCTNCGRHINPYYDMRKSNDSDIVNCNTDSCKVYSMSRCETDKKCYFSSVI